MTKQQRPPWRTGREVIEIAAQSLGAALVIVGLFVWLPIGPAMILAGVTLCAFGIAYEMSGGGSDGTRESVSDDTHDDGTAY